MLQNLEIAVSMANEAINETVCSNESDEEHKVPQGRPSLGGRVYGGGQLIDPTQLSPKRSHKKGIKSLFGTIKKLF